mgnify:CR=1 FL=1
MVDYYALISPTIEPLAGASPEERQVVYRRLVVVGAAEADRKSVV